MNLEEIKLAIEQGRKVYWSHEGCEVIKDCKGQYLIKCKINNYCAGLTLADGITMNGKEEHFFTLDY